MKTERLYDIAQRSDIFVYTLDTEQPSIAIEVDGIRAVSLRRDLTKAEERSYLSHELGHHIKGALYRKETPCITRGRCELRANTWAAHRLIPIRSLYAAFRKGCVEVWQLAEYFDVTEDFILKTIEIYKQEGKLPA